MESKSLKNKIIHRRYPLKRYVALCNGDNNGNLIASYATYNEEVTCTRCLEIMFALGMKRYNGYEEIKI